jgi:uncharacterized protein YjbI with pentapeptide repeats
MANDEHVFVLKQGVAAWHSWRRTNPDVVPDLTDADLHQADLKQTNLAARVLLLGAHLVNADLRSANLSGSMLNGADLRDAKLGGADLRGTNLAGANLTGADLTGADLRGAFLERTNLTRVTLTGAKLEGAHLQQAIFDGVNLSRWYLAENDLSGTSFREAILAGSSLVKANLRRADLSKANLARANLGGTNLDGANLAGAELAGADLLRADLFKTNLAGANLQGANLLGARLIEADLTDADLTGCCVYGISAWKAIITEGTQQQNLVITAQNEPQITVDSIEVAQFIYLMLHNQKIRDVIDTITSKMVLILGRFTPERKAVLDHLRNELRKRNYVPVIFDFEKPTNRTTVETITLLARMARFVIADVSDPKSILQELQAIVPALTSVPVQTLIVNPQEEPGMFDSFYPYPWFLAPFHYSSEEHLLANLERSVIDPAEAKVQELRGPR